MREYNKIMKTFMKTVTKLEKLVDKDAKKMLELEKKKEKVLREVERIDFYQYEVDQERIRSLKTIKKFEEFTSQLNHLSNPSRVLLYLDSQPLAWFYR